MNKILLGLSVFICLYSYCAVADPVLVNCKHTPGKIASRTNFKVQNKSNDLIRKSGHPETAEGKVIYIKGKILDSGCVPIQNARVIIYQADSFGNLVLDDEEKQGDVNFRMNGTSATDNIGQYSFITVYPGGNGGHPPRIHFLVEHRDFVPFETVMYFEKPSLKEVKAFLKKDTTNSMRELLVGNMEEDGVYNFNITLGGSNQHLHY